MLKKLETLEQVYPLVKDDPVRPKIAADWRIQNGREVYALYEDQYAEQDTVLFEGPRAVICVAYTNGIALTEQDLNNTQNPNTAMFYTVWSYDRGAGREIVLSTAKHIKDTREDIARFVTLSPLTEMAERFHLRNGAEFLRKGEYCQNFEYML
jgi:hypothetical protein